MQILDVSGTSIDGCNAIRLTKTTGTTPDVEFDSATADAGTQSSLQLAGEIIHIVRPVVYAATRCTVDGSTSWLPVGTSLAVELVGLACTILSAKRARQFRKAIDARAVEEISRRKVSVSDRIKLSSPSG